jgi:hypothetical protein
MGVAIGDHDNDGDADILTTTFSEDYFPLFEQRSPGAFEEVAFRAGLGQVTIPWLGWSCGFADLDNDGDQDLWIANGHVYPNAGSLGGTSYQQPIAVLVNENGKFSHAPDVSLPRGSYRGAAAGDLNQDGKIDLVVVPVDGAPLLLWNRSRNRNSWITFDLRSGRNREAIGAEVRIEACGRRQSASVFNGGGYLSRNDSRIHFGLGSCRVVTEVSVRFPDGKKRKLTDIDAGRQVSITTP